MSKRYSVAEARQELARLLNEVQEGQQVEITRRGEPVAVVLSLSDFKRLGGSTSDFGTAYRAWRARVDDHDLELPEDYFDSLRDRDEGRSVKL